MSIKKSSPSKAKNAQPPGSVQDAADIKQQTLNGADPNAVIIPPATTSVAVRDDLSSLPEVKDVGWDDKKLKQQLVDAQATEQLFLSVPRNLKDMQARINAYVSQDPPGSQSNSKFKDATTDIKAVLDHRLAQFRAKITDEVAMQLQASLTHDPVGLFRLLDGLASFIKYIVKLKADIIGGVPKSQYVENWRRLYTELSEMIAQTAKCPESLDVTKRTLLSNVSALTESELKTRQETITGETGLAAIKDQLKITLLIHYQNPEYIPKKFISVVGIGQTGKALAIREAVADVATAIQEHAYRKNGPYSLANGAEIDSNLWHPVSDFLTYRVADAVEIRRGELATPEEIVNQIKMWMTCASKETAANDSIFEMDGVPIRRVALLHIKNFDHLWMSDKQITDASADVTESFKLEHAGRLYVSNQIDATTLPVAASGKPTEVDLGLVGALTVTPTPSAPPPSTGTAAAPPSTATAAAATPTAAVPASGGSGSSFKLSSKRTAGKVGDNSHRQKLAGLLKDFLRTEYQQRMFPNVWIVFSMRYPWFVDEGVRKIITQTIVPIDLPSDSFRKAIFETEWDRMYIKSWVDRILRLIKIFDELSFRIIDVDNNGKVHTVDYDLTLPLSPYARAMLVTYEKIAGGEIQKVLDNKTDLNRYVTVEKWFTAFFFVLYHAQVKNFRLILRSDEEKKSFIRKMINRVQTLDPKKAAVPPDQLIIKDAFANIYKTRKDQILIQTGLLSRLVDYTGMGEDGFCMLQSVGIPDELIRKYLSQQGRTFTAGKFGFGLNLEQMYMFTEMLERTVYKHYLFEEVKREQRYLNTDIYAPDCADTVAQLRPEKVENPSEGWRLIGQKMAPSTSNKSNANIVETDQPDQPKPLGNRPTSRGPVVEHELTSCKGSIDILDLNIMRTTLDYFWTDDLVDQVITMLKDGTPTIPKIKPKRDYVAFVRNSLFNDPNATGLNVKISARCKEITRNVGSTGTSPAIKKGTAPTVQRSESSVRGQIISLPSMSGLSGSVFPRSGGIKAKGNIKKVLKKKTDPSKTVSTLRQKPISSTKEAHSSLSVMKY